MPGMLPAPAAQVKPAVCRPSRTVQSCTDMNDVPPTPGSKQPTRPTKKASARTTKAAAGTKKAAAGPKKTAAGTKKTATGPKKASARTNSDTGQVSALPSLVRPGFHFGVATAGFQVEGGFNGPGEPKNNWYRWEADGRVEPSGEALGFWSRYEEYLDLVHGLGCDSFRMSVEWSRVEPEEGHLDESALEHYKLILTACRDRGLMPLVTLHHFTHPRWLGEEFWLKPDSPQRFGEWVSNVVGYLGEECRHWVTLNEFNILALHSWMLGSFPPGKRGDPASSARALDNMLCAHIRAYEIIHREQRDAMVATNNYALSIYELDRMPLDILVARDRGIEHHALPAWLAERRVEHYGRVAVATSLIYKNLENVMRKLTPRLFPADSMFANATNAVYESDLDRFVDVAQLDFYAPGTAENFRLPGHDDAGGRDWLPFRPLWSMRPDPDGLIDYCNDAHVEGLDIWVVENGMCNRVRRGRSFPRIDGWTRDRYLRENISALVRASESGLPVSGYWHWTLADNYEWGSYEPRFGLFGVDRERGITISDRDSMGVDSASTYRELIRGIRAGDRSVLVGGGRSAESGPRDEP